MIRVEVPRPANVKNMKAEDLCQESRGEERMIVFTDAVDAMRAYEPNEYKPPMTANEYKNLAMRTCSIPYEHKREMLLHATTGLASEAGEFAGLLQKTYQGHEYDREHALR